MGNPENPYLPDRGAQLATLLMSLGQGFTAADATGRSPWAGLSYGAGVYGDANAQAQKQALEWQQQQQMMGYRERGMRLQEDELRDKQGERQRLRDGASAWSRANTPGFGVPPTEPTMGPGTYTGRVGGDESGGSYTIPNAKGSGAYGKYQFMPDTWAGVAQANPHLGLPMDMRQSTPEQQEAAMRAFTAANAQGLRSNGVTPSADNLYLAHRFGVQGANTMLAADPNTPVPALYPPKWTEQNPDMAGKTVGQFRQNVTQRYGTEIPKLEEVARPSLPAEDARYLASAVNAGALTPAQGEAEKQRIINEMWTAKRAEAQTRYQQGVELYKHQRGLETEGEWVRGDDGVERFTPKTQRTAGMPRADKPPEPGTTTGDVATLNKVFKDPSFVKSPEYAAAHNRAASHLIDGPNGLKYAPNMGAYPAPAAASNAPPAAADGAPAGLTPVGDRTYTETQNKDHTYAMRLANAIPQLEALLTDDKGKYHTGNVPSSREHMMGDSAYVPEAMVSEKTKKFRQLEKDILTATLRRESGASISSGEFVSERAKFIPMPGDSDADIRQKLQALKIAAKTFTEGTGRPASTYGKAFDYADAPKPTGPIKIDLSGRRQ